MNISLYNYNAFITYNQILINSLVLSNSHKVNFNICLPH